MKRIIILLVSTMLVSISARADEISELKSQVQELRQMLQSQQSEMENRRIEEEKRQDELQKMIQTLQGQLETMSAKKNLPAGEAETVPSSPRPKESPTFIERLLHEPETKTPGQETALIGERDKFKRQTPSGSYADPASFFYLHGYTTITYADFESGFGSVPGSAPQILVAGTSASSGRHESGFRNDTALFIGSDLSENLNGTFELHFVGNAIDPVITESKISWTPFDINENYPSLRLVGGRYWWPFGIHNSEWFSAINDFNLQSPAATESVPAHYNELGVMAEGEWAVTEDFGINYLFSIGNGVSSFELSDNISSSNAFDSDSNRTFTTRLGFFPWIENLTIGLNFATGALRRGTDTRFDTTDARRFEADLLAYGIDSTYKFKDLKLRGYWYASEEDLEGASVDKLDRNGGTLDIIYTFLKDAPLFKEVSFKTRASTVKDATLSDGSFRRSQYGIGLNARPNEHFLLKTEYFFQDENGIADVDDDGFILSGTVEW